MITPRPIALTVELEPGPGPISGRVRHASGAEERFAGWLELSSALEHARDNVGAPPPAAAA